MERCSCHQATPSFRRNLAARHQGISGRRLFLKQPEEKGKVSQLTRQLLLPGRTAASSRPQHLHRSVSMLVGCLFPQDSPGWEAYDAVRRAAVAQRLDTPPEGTFSPEDVPASIRPPFPVARWPGALWAAIPGSAE